MDVTAFTGTSPAGGKPVMAFIGADETGKPTGSIGVGSSGGIVELRLNGGILEEIGPVKTAYVIKDITASGPESDVILTVSGSEDVATDLVATDTISAADKLAVNINSTGRIVNPAGLSTQMFTAHDIALNTPKGSIGTADVPIQINLTGSGGQLDAGARDSIFLTAPAGDLRVGTVTSTTGDITLTTGENLIVANGAGISTLAGTINLQAGDDLSVAAGTAVSAGGQVFIRGDYGDVDAGWTIIEVYGQIYGSSVEIAGGDQNDIFALTNVGSGSPTTVLTGAGDDTIHVGSHATPASNSGGTLNGILAQLTIDGGSGNDVLSMDDTGDTAANTGRLTGDQVIGLGIGAGVTYAGFETLRIDLGGGGDTFTVENTHAGPTTLNTNGGSDRVDLLANVGTLIIDAGAGVDTINVRTTGAPATVNGGADDDTINVGSNAPGMGGTVNPIDARLTVNGNEGSDTLNVDDSGDAAANTGTLTETQLTGLGMGFGLTYGTVDHLNIFLGSGGDAFTIRNTHAGATRLSTSGGDDAVNVLMTTGPAAIETDEGQDIINVRTISAPMTANGGTGDDTINVGSLAPDTGGTVNGISARLTINDEGGNDTLNLDDAGDAADNAGELSETRITGLGMGSADQKTVNASLGIDYAGFESLNIALGSGSDTFAIFGEALLNNLDAGSGGDTLIANLSDEADTVSASAGLLVRNGLQTAYLNVETLVLNTLGGWDVIILDAGPGFPGAVDVNSGDGDDTITVNLQAGAETQISIDGGAPSASDTVIVNGTDADDWISAFGVNVSYDLTTIALAAAENLTICGGGGNDNLTATGVILTGALILRGEAGNDTFTLNFPIRAASLSVEGGGGANTLVINLMDGAGDVTWTGNGFRVGSVSASYSGMGEAALNAGNGGGTLTVSEPPLVYTRVNAGGERNGVSQTIPAIEGNPRLASLDYFWQHFPRSGGPGSETFAADIAEPEEVEGESESDTPGALPAMPQDDSGESQGNDAIRQTESKLLRKPHSRRGNGNGTVPRVEAEPPAGNADGATVEIKLIDWSENEEAPARVQTDKWEKMEFPQPVAWVKDFVGDLAGLIAVTDPNSGIRIVLGGGNNGQSGLKKIGGNGKKNRTGENTQDQ